MAREIFNIGGITPEVLIKTDKGIDLQSTTKTSIWQNGPIKYVGLLNQPEHMGGGIKPSDKINVSILFKQKGHLYDVREKKYLGSITNMQPIKADITPSIANIYAISPYKVDKVEVTSDKRNYKAGDIITLSVKVKVSNGQPGNHISYTEVYGPDKEKRAHYTQKVILEQGVGIVRIPTAFNDTKGVWNVVVKDVMSGITEKINVRITE